jgi:AcrR family transcriptional regulator
MMPETPSQRRSRNARPRRARGSLSAEEILSAAYLLVEHDGLEALSMPALSRQIGAGVTSIYWYFRNKDELLVALAEQVTADVYRRWQPLGDGSWDEEMRRSFISFRQELSRVPVYLELFSLRPRFVLTQPSIFPVVMERLEADSTKLVEAGLNAVDAASAHYACSVYVRGFVTLEHGRRIEPTEPDGTKSAGLFDTIGRPDPIAFPVLSLLGDLESITVLDDASFVRGLDLLLEGIRGEVELQTETNQH